MKKLIMFVTIALSMVLFSCGNNKNEIKYSENEKYKSSNENYSENINYSEHEKHDDNEIKLGDAVFVSQECIVAADEDSYDEMTKLCNRKDERGLELMSAQGRIAILEEGTSGIVVDMEFGKMKIRLSDDKEVWCANEFLHK